MPETKGKTPASTVPAMDEPLVRWSIIVIGAGLAFILLQLVFEFLPSIRALQLKSYSKGTFPIGLVVMIVGAAMLAFAAHNRRANRDEGADGGKQAGS